MRIYKTVVEVVFLVCYVLPVACIGYIFVNPLVGFFGLIISLLIGSWCWFVLNDLDKKEIDRNG